MWKIFFLVYDGIDIILTRGSSLSLKSVVVYIFIGVLNTLFFQCC